MGPLLCVVLIQLVLYISAQEHGMVIEEDVPNPRYGLWIRLPGVPLLPAAATGNAPSCATAALCCRTLCAGATTLAACSPGGTGITACLGVGGVGGPGTPCLVMPTPPACPACTMFTCPGTAPPGPTAMMCMATAAMQICPP